MHLPTLLRSAVVLAVLALSACSNPIGIYRGTTTQTLSAGGMTQTKTIAGDLVTVFASNDPNSLVFESTGLAYTATKSGDALTFPGGQAQTITETNGMSSTTLTSGTGTLTTTSLTLNLLLTVSQTGGGQTQNTNATIAFTGQKI
ncbi:MAG: hypothetical protein JNJ54_18480 [Myxococcaceae bacterium]|nr:hypothetical protein [Myxococcaceae bacterium]